MLLPIFQRKQANKTTYFIFDVNGRAKTENILDSVLTNYTNRNNLNLDDLKTNFAISSEKSFEIIEFPFPSFPGIWLGLPFYTAQAKYAVFYKDFLVFCNSSEGLQNYLKTMAQGNALANDTSFKRVEGLLENKSNINSYVNIENGINIFSELLNAALVKQLRKKNNVLQQIKAMGWQLGSEKEVFTNELCLVFEVEDEGEIEEAGQNTAQNQDGKSNSNVVWKCNIGNQLITKPVFTINHNDPSNLEIVVQDDSYQLHLLSSKGKINWSFDVGEAIISEIFQVDVLANGKYQYLFSTKRKLFMVDREGKMVDGFPVEFPVEATAGVNVFDYDNNRNYRCVVPFGDRRIVVYDKNGKLVEGWNFKGTESEVTTPVQHFRIKGKDYIVFKDKERIYIQNRRGENIATPNVEFENSENPLILNPLNKSELLATDENGRIYVIGFDGATRKIDAGKFDDDHFFTAADLNGDNLLEFVFVDGRKLSILNESGTVLFTKKLKGTIQYQPDIYDFGGGKKKVGVVDSRANLIYLLDANGQNHPGFPLNGASEFSIGKIKKRFK